MYYHVRVIPTRGYKGGNNAHLIGEAIGLKRLSSKARWIAVLCVVALIALAIGVSGAYFSDSKSGAITGTNGSIKVMGSGGSGENNLDIAFMNLLPGVPQSVTANYQNTGESPQDVWLVFSNKTALSALNSLGTYGEAHIAANGTEIFASTNLNDHPVDQGTNCKMVPEKILLASNVGPTVSGNFSFSFMYASKIGGSGGGVWNTFPVLKASNQGTGGYPTNDGSLKNYDQYYVAGADGNGAGLPYKIVAVQVGQQP